MQKFHSLRLHIRLLSPISVPRGRLVHLAAASIFSAMALLGIYFAGDVFSLPERNEVRSVVAATSTPKIPSTGEAPVSKSAPQLEVHIANNGHVYLRGTRVTAIYNGSMYTMSKWGLIDFVWTIDTSGSTRYIGKGGEYVERTKIAVGDVVAVTGVLDGSGKSPEIDAKYVRLSR